MGNGPYLPPKGLNACFVGDANADLQNGNCLEMGWHLKKCLVAKEDMLTAAATRSSTGRFRLSCSLSFSSSGQTKNELIAGGGVFTHI